MKIFNFHRRGFGVSGFRGFGGLRPGWLLFAVLILTSFGVAVDSEASFCCERRAADGAWCVNDVESACREGDGYKAAPTSCESTAYCRLGTCYDSEEGICMENTPQRTCIESEGTWDDREIGEVPQCQLGCCVIADQAAFVSLVRCKRLSSLFGVENDYRTDIDNEVECIAVANAQDKGACVYESGYERICEFTTRGDCGASEVVEVTEEVGEGIEISSGKTFYEDYLCSAEELATTCARQVSTTCYDGDVYWVDSCGNRENVYSGEKARDKEESWARGRVVEAEDVCDVGDGDCGNCDYLFGSRCAEGGGLGVDHYCRTTECKDRDGEPRVNGESWCVRDDDRSSVGAREFREVCVDGEVRIEPCSDYRNEICLEGSIDIDEGRKFGTAACRVNRWQDCVAQVEEDVCEDRDYRDCVWVDSVKGMLLGSKESGVSGQGSVTSYSNPGVDDSGDAFKNPTASPITGQAIFGDDAEAELEDAKTNRPDGICVPSFPPGLKFWEDSSAKEICGQASAKCVVVYEKGLLDGHWDIVKGKECLDPDGDWAAKANGVCSALGDCGGAVNYIDEETHDGYKWVEDKEERWL